MPNWLSLVLVIGWWIGVPMLVVHGFAANNGFTLTAGFVLMFVGGYILAEAEGRE